MRMRAASSVTLAWVFCCVASAVVSGSESCTKAAKAETYLDTAAELLERIKENLPEDGANDCSCPPKPMDCAELLTCGHNQSGVYKIWPRNRILRGSVDVFCDMDTEGGGWTVIQRRGDFKRPSDYFVQNWYRYKTGFGDIRRDFWLGNDNIYALTNQNKYYLRFDLTDFENNTRYAFYDQFWIDSESQNYKLHVYDYSGDAGDSFSKFHDGQPFSTLDRDNDNSTENCAMKFKGGWWYSACHGTNLNGIYYSEKPGSKSGEDGVIWHTWKGRRESLQHTEMKIRPSDFRSHILDWVVEPV